MSSTLRHFAYPVLAGGVSLVSTAVAWTWPASYTEMVPASTITSTFYISGLTAGLNVGPTLDTRLYVNFSLGKGSAGSETEIIQFSMSYYGDSNTGSFDGFQFILPEAVEVAANTRVAGRVTVGQALAVTFTNVKLMYEMA